MIKYVLLICATVIYATSLMVFAAYLYGVPSSAGGGVHVEPVLLHVVKDDEGYITIIWCLPLGRVTPYFDVKVRASIYFDSRLNTDVRYGNISINWYFLKVKDARIALLTRPEAANLQQMIKSSNISDETLLDHLMSAIVGWRRCMEDASPSCSLETLAKGVDTLCLVALLTYDPSKSYADTSKGLIPFTQAPNITSFIKGSEIEIHYDYVELVKTRIEHVYRCTALVIAVTACIAAYCLLKPAECKPPEKLCKLFKRLYLGGLAGKSGRR